MEHSTRRGSSVGIRPCVPVRDRLGGLATMAMPLLYCSGWMMLSIPPIIALCSNLQFQPFQATAVGQFCGHLQWVGFWKCTKVKFIKDRTGLISPNELAETMQVTSSMFLACTNLGVTDRELGHPSNWMIWISLQKTSQMIDMELNM